MSLISIKDKYHSLKNEMENILDKEIDPVLKLFKNDFLIPLSKDENNFIDSFYRLFSDESDTTEKMINDLVEDLKYGLKKLIKDELYNFFDYGMNIKICYLESSYLNVFAETLVVLNTVEYLPNGYQKEDKKISKSYKCLLNINVENINVCKSKEVTISI